MKTNKAVITLLSIAVLCLTLVLGCSYLRKAPTSPSSMGGESLGSKDYFPLPLGAKWKYRSTTNDGKQSEFSMTVLNNEIEGGEPLYLVETVSTFQAIHDWYSKPNGWVLMIKQEYVKTGNKAEYQPAKQFLKNPLTSGDSWHWKGKGMMGLEIDESNNVSGPESVSVPA